MEDDEVKNEDAGAKTDGFEMICDLERLKCKVHVFACGNDYDI